jgi:hypothetical protein
MHGGNSRGGKMEMSSLEIGTWAKDRKIWEQKEIQYLVHLPADLCSNV